METQHQPLIAYCKQYGAVPYGWTRVLATFAIPATMYVIIISVFAAQDDNPRVAVLSSGIAALLTLFGCAEVLLKTKDADNPFAFLAAFWTRNVSGKLLRVWSTEANGQSQLGGSVWSATGTSRHATVIQEVTFDLALGGLFQRSRIRWPNIITEKHLRWSVQGHVIHGDTLFVKLRYRDRKGKQDERVQLPVDIALRLLDDVWHGRAGGSICANLVRLYKQLDGETQGHANTCTMLDETKQVWSQQKDRAEYLQRVVTRQETDLDTLRKNLNTATSMYNARVTGTIDTIRDALEIMRSRITRHNRSLGYLSLKQHLLHELDRLLSTTKESNADAHAENMRELDETNLRIVHFQQREQRKRPKRKPRTAAGAPAQQ
ncbi:MAG: hypothetical protein Q7T01_02285 [bacterium]|nr:hypothetical protein [bacterium]